MAKEQTKDHRVVTKVRWNGTVGKIWYMATNQAGTSDEFYVKFHEAPQPEFQAILKALNEHVLTLTENQKPWGKTMRVLGANFNAGCAQIVCTKALMSGKAFNFNTPKTLIYKDEDDDTDHLPEACAELLENLAIEAKKYLDGDRLQGSLFPLKQ